MKGVTFGTLHSYDDFSLILSRRSIGLPEPKIMEANVPESDGVVDLTEYFGEIKYSNRPLKFIFSVENGSFDLAFSAIQNALHGKRMKITLDDDPNFYYMGRVIINEWTSSPILQTITVECDCEPYKYKQGKTIVTTTVSTSKTLTVSNLKKKTIPIFTTSATFTIQFGTISVSKSAGTFMIPELQLIEGNNQIKFLGTGNVTIEYQERGL